MVDGIGVRNGLLITTDSAEVVSMTSAAASKMIKIIKDVAFICESEVDGIHFGFMQEDWGKATGIAFTHEKFVKIRDGIESGLVTCFNDVWAEERLLKAIFE